MTPINEAKPKQQGQKTNLNDEPLAEQVIGLIVPVSQVLTGFVKRSLRNYRENL